MKKEPIRLYGPRGQVVEFIALKGGGNLTRDDTGRVFYKHPGTDITVRGFIEPRTPRAPGKGLKPRAAKIAHITAMGSKSRLGMSPDRPDPMQLLRTGRGLGRHADRAGVDITAQAGWYAKTPSRGTGEINYPKENGRLKKVYGAFGMKPDAAQIKKELASARTLTERKIMGRLIRQSTPLLRKAAKP